MGIDKDYSIEDIRSLSVEKLYDILASCQSPGYYQMAVEELQRRFLMEIGAQTRSLTATTERVETSTAALTRAVSDVDTSIGRLVASSNTMERLTKWIIGLTIALLLLTVAQVVLIVRDQLRPRTATVETPTPSKAPKAGNPPPATPQAPK